MAVTINIGTGQGNREDWFNLPVEEQWRRAGYKVVWKPGVEGSALRAKGWTPPGEVPAEAWQRQIAGMEAWRRVAEAPKVERGVERAEEKFERKRRRPYFPMPLKEWPKPEVVTPPPPVAVKAVPPKIEVPPPTVEKPEGTREAVETIRQQLTERPFLPPTAVEAIGKPAPEVVTAPLGGALEAWRAWKRQPITGIIPRTAEEAVKGAVKALQQPAYWLERGIGTYALEAMKRRPKAAYERVVSEHPMTHLEAAALLGGVEIKPEQVEAWRRADEKLRELNLPPRETAELARTYYTWGAHPERLEKALDEIKQGASIDEVARKYEDPIVEAVGQIVLDPLNVAGAWLGKLRDVRLLNRVRNQFVRKAEPIVQETVEQMPWFKRAWQQIGGKVEQLNPFRITAHSKARALDRHLNSFTGLVLRRAKTPDEAKILLKSFVEAPESLPPEFGSFVKSPAAKEVRKALAMMDIDSFRTLKPDREFKLMDFLSELYDKSIRVTNELYGVKPPSTAEKYAQGFKSFMADFYMGISPRALIRNAAGNVSFLTYDGLLSFASHNHIDDYMVRSFGFSPAQFQRGLGLTREYRGPKRGLPIIRELADLGRRLYSGKIPLLGEAWARYGASYRACQKFDSLYWRPGGLIDLSAFDDLWPYIDPNTKANLIAAWRQSLNGEELIENTEKALSGLTLVARYIDDAEEVSPGFIKALQEVVDEAGDDTEKLIKGIDEVAAEVEKRLARAERLENLPVTVKPKEAALLPGIEAAEEFRKGKPEEVVRRTYATMVREMAERGATAEGLWMNADEMAHAAYELGMWKKGDYIRRAWAKHVSPDIPFPTKLTELRRFIDEHTDLAKKWQDYLWAKMAEANTPTYQLLNDLLASEGIAPKTPKVIKEVEAAAEKAADLQAELYQAEQYLESLQDYLKAQPLDQKTVFKLWDYRTGTFKRVRDRATGKLVTWEYTVTDEMATELGFRSQEDLLQAVRDYVDAHKKVKELKGRIKALKAELASLPKGAVEEGKKLAPKAEEVAEAARAEEAVEAAKVEEAVVEAAPEVAKVAGRPTTMAERVAKMTKNEARKRLETIENFLDEQKRLGRAIAPKLEKDLRAEANALRAKLGMKKAMEVVHADEVAEYKRLIRQLHDYIDRGYPESETGRIQARLDEIAERAKAEGWWDELREFTKPSGWEIVGEPKLVEEAAAPPKPKAPKPEAASKMQRYAANLRKKADALTKQIEAKRKPAIAGLRPTPRRARIAAAMQEEADRLERIQAKLYALADQAEAGTLPPRLTRLKHKSDIETAEWLIDWARRQASRAGVEDALHRPLDDEILAFVKVPPQEWRQYKAVKRWKVADADELRAFLRDYAQIEVTAGRTPEEIRLAELERAILGQKIPGYFPTPRPVVEEMLDLADIPPGAKVLEPSAGKGNIADVIREAHPDVDLATIEIHPQLRQILEAKGYKVVGDDFLKHTGQYDRIVMNPPFEKGQDIDHVRHAYDQLKPGGRLVSVMSEGTFHRGDRKARAFRAWLDEVGGYSRPLPEGAFRSTERPTGVAARLVVIDKPRGVTEEVAKAIKPKAPPKILPGGVQPADWVHTPKGDGIAARTARVRSGAVLTWVYAPEKGRAFSVPVTDISKAEPPDEYVKWLGEFAEWAQKQAKRFKGSTAKDYERIATRALSRAAAMTSGMPSYAKGVRSASEAELKLIERLKKGITRDKAEPVAEELKRVFLDRVKQVLVPAREDANMAKLQWAYEVVNRALYDYDKRYEFDRLLSLFFPFHFWPTRTGYQAAMRMITKPWTVTSYYRMRKAIERINEEMGFPRRYGPTALFVPAPEGVAEALPEWAEKRVSIDIMPFIFPHVGVWPFNYLAKVNWDDNDEAKTALDRLADLQHIFGMAPHWPLQVALDMARGKRENIWYILPQTGVLKGMTAYMREKWPERFGWIPPGGLNIEKPFRVGLGLPEAAGYEAEYWPESMVLDMAANEEITPEERDAVLNPASPMYHKGPIWEEAVNRAAILKQLPTAVSYFLGIRPRLLPKGEMRIRRAEGLAEIYERERAGEKGPEIREARRKWYEANPWYTSRGLLWTPGPERVVQFREREYYDKRSAIYDRYAKELDKVPLGDWRARQTIYRRRQEELDALDDEYKDIVRTPSFWGWTPSEIETYYEDQALRPVAEAYYAIQPEQFKDKEGKIDWDAFYRARDEFLNNPKKWLPYLDKSALREMGIKGKIPQLSWLTRARLERYLRRNDDPKEALWRVYKETVINPAQKVMFAEAEGLSGAERAELFDKYYSNYPARPATEFITRVLAMYPEKGWTYDQLAEIYRDITLPGLKEVRRRGMSPRDRAISDLWEFYMALPALDKKRFRKALGDRFQRLFVNRKTRDYDAITDEELIYWLNYAGLDPGLLPEMAEARGTAVKAAEAEFLKEWGAYEPRPLPGTALTEAGLQAGGRFQRVSPELAAEYDQALRERAEMWEAVRSIVPNYSELMDAYSKLKWWQFKERKALREQLEPAWRFMDEWKASHPVMVKWFYPTWQPYTPKPKRTRGRRRRKTKRETLEDMAADWRKFAEGMEDKGLLELIQSYLLLPEAQRGWFLRRYPDLAAWLQDKSPEWLAALAQSLAAYLALTEPRRRRVRRAPKLRWYTIARR